jgi:DNA-binding transcriptional LysR family regulator
LERSFGGENKYRVSKESLLTMRYKLLGNSGLRVIELALGTMTFGDENGHGVVEAVIKAQTVAALTAVPELHVGYSPTPTARILPDTLRAFHSAMPETRVKLHDFSNHENIAGLRDGRLQIAFIFRPQKVGALRGLRTEELSREAVRLAVPSSHPFARRKVISLEEAAREPIRCLQPERIS